MKRLRTNPGKTSWRGDLPGLDLRKLCGRGLRPRDEAGPADWAPRIIIPVLDQRAVRVHQVVTGAVLEQGQPAAVPGPLDVGICRAQRRVDRKRALDGMQRVAAVRRDRRCAALPVVPAKPRGELGGKRAPEAAPGQALQRVDRGRRGQAGPGSRGPGRQQIVDAVQRRGERRLHVRKTDTEGRRRAPPTSRTEQTSPRYAASASRCQRWPASHHR
jgi:hypothetical protein